jgi:hypothetical protein
MTKCAFVCVCVRERERERDRDRDRERTRHDPHLTLPPAFPLEKKRAK